MRRVVKAMTVRNRLYSDRIPDWIAEIIVASRQTLLKDIPAVLQTHCLENHMHITLRYPERVRASGPTDEDRNCGPKNEPSLGSTDDLEISLRWNLLSLLPEQV